MKLFKKATSLMLTLLLLVSVMPAALTTSVFAASFVDFPTGWSAEAMQAAVDNGLMFGKGDNTIAPQANFTRAEAAAVINRAFGATVKADISSYTDVTPSDWYYDDFAKAVNMKTIVGDGSGKLNPEGNITREEIFTVVARALVLSDPDTEVLNSFSDSSLVSAWAAPYISALVKYDYIHGNGDDMLNPKGYITREEFAQMLHNIFKTYISASGTVTSVGSMCVIVRTPGVTLKDVTIDRDLVLGDGVGAGDIVLDNVKINGRLLCRGGEGTVKLVNVTVGDKVVVYDVNGTVNFLNYEDEKPFEGKDLHTPATFLQKSVTPTKPSGGGGSRTTSVAYKVKTYLQNASDHNFYADTTREYTYRDAKGKNITYSPNSISGYEVFDAISILEGKNNGDLVLKVYYKIEGFIPVIIPAGTTGEFDDVNDIFADDAKLNVLWFESGDMISDNGNLDDYALSKTGYDFTWNTSKDGTGSTVDNNTVVTGPITVYPKFVPIQYTYSFDLNGGNIGGDTNPITGTYDIEDAGSIIPTSTPVKEGCQFAGWIDEDGYPFTFTPGTTIGNINAKAKWNPITPGVTYYAITLTYDDTKSLKNVTGATDLSNVEKGSNVTITFTPNAGYEIDTLTAPHGLVNGNKVTYTSVASDDEVTLVVKPIQYSYRFDLDGGNIGGNANPVTGTYTIETPGSIVPSTPPSKDGYQFNGWVDGSGSPFTFTPGTTIGDLVVKASWIPTSAPTDEKLAFDASINGDAVTVKVTLTGLPGDIESINAMTIRYSYDDTKLEYVKATSQITGGTFNESAGNISWFSIGDGLDSSDFTSSPLTLFTMTFNKKSGAYGDAKFDFTYDEIADIDGTKSAKYVTEGDTVNLGTAPVISDEKLAFDASINGDAVTVKVTLTGLPADIESINAMTIRYSYDDTKLEYVKATSQITGGTFNESAGNISWFNIGEGLDSSDFTSSALTLFTMTFNKKSGAYGDAKFDFTYDEIADIDGTKSAKYVTEGDTVNLGTAPVINKVKLYIGTKEVPGNYKGSIDVESNDTVTQSEIDAIIGSVDSYKIAGYTNSDGEVHYIYPELWVNNGTAWELFDIDEPITSDIDVCLLTRNIAVYVQNDLYLDGSYVPGYTEISLEIPYDSESSVAESVLDALKKGRTLTANIIAQLESRGVYVYDNILEKLEDRGIINSDRYILDQTLTLKLSDFITAEKIKEEFEGYLETNLLDDEFVATVLKNESAVNFIIGNAQLKSTLLSNATLRDMFVNDAGVIAAIGSKELAEMLITAYSNDELSLENRTIVDQQIDNFLNKSVEDYVNNVNRDVIRTLIRSNIPIAVDACKSMDAYTMILNDFEQKKENLTVNKENVIFIRGIASTVREYTYDKIKAEFISEELKSLINYIDEDIVEGYITEALTKFADGLDTKCQIVENSLNPDITESCKASLEIVVDVMSDWVYPYYRKAMNKIKDKLVSTPEVKYDENTYLKQLVETDMLGLFIEETSAGYKLKFDDIMDYYDAVYNQLVLAHDALIWYNTLDKADIDSNATAAAAFIAIYAKKVNNIVMNFINNEELPKGFTLDKILNISEKIRDLYNKNEDRIEKIFDFYAKYLDQDYDALMNEILTKTVNAEGENFKATDIALEIKSSGDVLFGIDSVFDALLNGNNSINNPDYQEKINKVVNKMNNVKFTPATSTAKYYVDAYKGNVASRTLRGRSTGNSTVEIDRFLQLLE